MSEHWPMGNSILGWWAGCIAWYGCRAGDWRRREAGARRGGVFWSGRRRMRRLDQGLPPRAQEWRLAEARWLRRW